MSATPTTATATTERELPPLRRGWTVVAGKELADHFLSVRFVVLLVLLGVAATGAVYAAAGGIREVAPSVRGGVSFPFLRLFTVAPTEQLPALLTLVSFLAPLLGIAFGFDAINGERAQGTLPRLLAQPIHRDDVINGKFVAGLTVISTVLLSLVLLVAGVGMFRLGLTPTADEVARLVAWLVVTILYVGFWLGLAMLCSVALRRAATSALLAITAWLLLTLFFGLLIGVVSDALASSEPTAEAQLANVELQQTLSRISPQTLYTESTRALLAPEERTLNQFLTLSQVAQLQQAPQTPLGLTQSLLLAVPQMVVLVGMTIACFAIAYVLFMRQEVRA